MTVTVLVSAFVAGLVSFLSPCVLPLVPVYLAQLVGPTVAHTEDTSATPPKASSTTGTTGTTGAVAVRAGQAPTRRLDTLAHAAAFVAGFGLAFVALGATASVLGALLTGNQIALRRVGGILLVLFGLHVADIVRIPGLERERRFYLRTGAPGYVTSLALGLVFALGWTPCVGPYLAAILVLAARAHTLGSGVALLAVYALGLGLPFLVAGAAVDRITPALRRLSPYLGIVERVAGVLLALLGVAIFFNWLLVVNSWFSGL